MNKNIKLNYMTSADPATYNTICPKIKGSKVTFNNANTLEETWGDYTIHNPLSSTTATNALAEVEGNINIYGKVASAVTGISGSAVGMVGYGNMAIYVSSSATNTLYVYNTSTSTLAAPIILPTINDLTPVIKDIALVKLDKEMPEVGLLCYVGSSVYYISYSVASANALNTYVSYSLVSTLTGTGTISLSSRFLRTKKELVIINGALGYNDGTYGAVGQVMVSADGDEFSVVDELNGASNTVYLPLGGSMYYGDDAYGASCVIGDSVVHRPLLFTIEDGSLNTHITFSSGAFNPMGRDLNTGNIMFSTSSGWWRVKNDGTFENFTTFQSPQIPTMMICVNGLKVTNAGYYYNADGLTTGRALKDTSGNAIAPSSSQQLLKLYPLNNETMFIYAPSTNKWYMTSLLTNV